MPFNEDGSRKTALYKRSGFKLRSGNNMKGSSFKYMGSSPLETEGHEGEEGHSHAYTVDDVQGLEGVGTSGGEEHFVHLDAADKAQKLRADAEKSSGSKLDLISERLGGTWTKNKSGQFRNQDNMTVAQVESATAEEKLGAMEE